MRLVIREYLSMLRESGELDVLLPDLLLAMGIDVLTRPGTGPRQFGVDLPAVGADPDDHRQKLFLLTIKRGDITRTDWDSGPQAVRQSLNEIRDVYLPNYVRPEHESLPKKIVLVTGGELKQAVEPNWQGYVREHAGIHARYGELEYDFWGGDRLSGLIDQFFLDEYLFPESAQKQIRKTIALADQNEDEPHHFYALIDETLFGRDLPIDQTGAAQRKRQKALRLLNLSLNIVFHWCQEANNLRPALLCAERVMLRTWDWMRQWECLTCTTTVREYERLSASYLTILRAYALKLQPYCDVRDGFFGQGEDHIEYPLRIFEIIGILSLYSIMLSFLLTRVQDVQELDTLRHQRDAAIQLVINVIKHNPPARTPRFDGHAIDIALGLLAMIYAGCSAFAAQWVEELTWRIIFAYQLGRHFPIASDSFDDLVAMSFGRAAPKEKLTELSTLLPMLAEWYAVLGMSSYSEFQKAVGTTFPHTDLQMWYPDTTTDDYLYHMNAGLTSGATLSSIQLPETLEGLCARILQLREFQDVSSTISCVTQGWSILGLVASRHFRTPILPLYWQDQVDELDDLSNTAQE